MADKKITQLDPITGANLADTDEFVVVDLSADETKSITFAELKNGFDTGTGFVRITGDTMTGNLSFGDSNKIIMGAGSDLQLYHDGSNSYVSDQGTGQLVLLSNSFRLNNAANSENIITAEENGAVSLFFNDSSKLATTATGISVSGDASIGHASPTAILDVRRGDASGKIAEFHTSTGFGIELGSSQSEAYIQAGSNQALLFNTNVSNERMRITSAGRVGVGTNSPDAPLHVEGASGTQLVVEATSGDFAQMDFKIGGTQKGAIWTYEATDLMGFFAPSGWGQNFYTNGTETMRLTSSGNVGIGDSSPSRALSTKSSSVTVGSFESTSASGGLISFVDPNTTNDVTVRVGSLGNNLVFQAGGTETMRLTSSGNMALGTTSANEYSGYTSLTLDNATNGGIIDIERNGVLIGEIFTIGTNFIIQQNNSGGVIQLKNHDNTEDIEFGQDYFRIKQGGAQRMYMNSAGETTFSTKVSVTAADGVRDADYVATFQNQEATSGRNFGVSIAGGTSGSDIALNVVNGAANTALFRVYGDGTTSISGGVLINNSAYGANGTLVVQQTADSKGIAIIDSAEANTFFLENDGTINKIRNNSTVPIAFETNSTERMRLDSSGKLYFGTNGADPSSSQTGVRISSTDNTNFWMSSTPRTSAYDQLAFFNGNGLVGTITTSGSATAYNTSSDYRLKTDAKPMTGASERVQALNPVNFEWVADGTRVDGFLAHEAQAVVPESVTGTKDAVDADGNPEYQSIDQSKIVPLLTAALQEALTEITALKARVTTLEGA